MTNFKGEMEVNQIYNILLQEEEKLAKYVTKKYGNYDLTSDLKTCGHISFDILGSIFCLGCRYLRYLKCLRYIDLKVEKKTVVQNKTVLLLT